MKSILLVSIQFAAIICLIAVAHPFTSVLATTLIITGIILGLWAILTMRHSKLNITPDIIPSATLVTSGPYHYLRHPMYSAVLLTCLGLLLTHPSVIGIVVYFILVIDLITKISYEEKLLAHHFSQYSHYQQHTHRLISKIW